MELHGVSRCAPRVGQLWHSLRRETSQFDFTSLAAALYGDGTCAALCLVAANAASHAVSTPREAHTGG